jgi:ABC-type transport system substrate-binding protein
MASHIWGPKIAGAATAAELFALDASDDVAGGPTDLVQVGDDRIVARANPGYQGKPSAPIVEYVVFASEADLLAELTRGGIHTMASPHGLLPDQAATLAQSEGIATVTNPKFGVRYMSFNTKREPMNDLAFRRAVAALVDREALATEVASSPIANTMLPAAASAWFDEPAATAIAGGLNSDLATSWEAILAGLKASGYSWNVEPTLAEGKLVGGTGLQIKGRAPAALTILTSGDSYDPARPEYANRIAAAIELLGFKVIPVTTDFTSVVDLAFTPDEEGKVHYDMALLGWSLGNPGLPTFYGDLFGTSGVANNTGYSSAAMDALIKSLDKAPNVEEALSAIWKMESLIAQDLPYLPLYASEITEAYRADLVAYPDQSVLGGIQAALAGIELVTPQD